MVSFEILFHQLKRERNLNRNYWKNDDGLALIERTFGYEYQNIYYNQYKDGKKVGHYSIDTERGISYYYKNSNWDVTFLPNDGSLYLLHEEEYE